MFLPCRPSSAGPRGPSRQRGAALVVALLVFALSTALVVAMKSEFLLGYQRGSNLFIAAQAEAYLRGAEDLAALALVLDFDEDKQRESPRDDLEEFWAQPATPYSLDDGGWLMGQLEDLQGRFNLNALVSRETESDDGPRYTPAQQQFIRLLQALPELAIDENEAIVITQSIGDWLDADSNPSLYGAEDDFYFGQTPAYRSANRPMVAVSELRAVANITPELYDALLPWVSALPEAGTTLNIHTAAPMLLRTVNEPDDLSPLTEEDGQALVEQRCSGGFADVADFLAQPPFSGKDMTAIEPLLGETTDYFALSAEAEVAERRVRLYSVLERRGRAINTLDRAGGSLYSYPTQQRTEYCSTPP